MRTAFTGLTPVLPYRTLLKTSRRNPLNALYGHECIELHEMLFIPPLDAIFEHLRNE